MKNLFPDIFCGAESVLVCQGCQGCQGQDWSSLRKDLYRWAALGQFGLGCAVYACHRREVQAQATDLRPREISEHSNHIQLLLPRSHILLLFPDTTHCPTRLW